jgi:homoserine dehydrogenase
MTGHSLRGSPSPGLHSRQEIQIKIYNLCLLGFGNVNRTLVRLLVERTDELRAGHGINWRITGVASRRLGWIASPEGLDANALCSERFAANAGEAPLVANQLNPAANVHDWLEAGEADVLFEATSLNVEDGQPAVDHIRTALEHGAHAITANKGPVVYAYDQLRDLASRKGKRFLFETTVMDGVPIFTLFRDCLPTVKLQAFRGILNSTTNVILSGMEDGLTFEQSLRKAHELGVAETDPSYDIDGWDASIKVAALATVLMGVALRPGDIRREGIRGIDEKHVREARDSGFCYKLVCRARREGHGVSASVAPERLPLSDPMAQVRGTSSIISFATDIFPELVVTEHNPGLETTAYGMLSDFIRIAGTQC